MEILSVDIFGSRIHEHIFQKSETGICSSLHGIGIFRCFALAPNAARVAYHLSATHNAVLSFHLHHPNAAFRHQPSPISVVSSSHGRKRRRSRAVSPRSVPPALREQLPTCAPKPPIHPPRPPTEDFCYPRRCPPRPFEVKIRLPGGVEVVGRRGLPDDAISILSSSSSTLADTADFGTAPRRRIIREVRRERVRKQRVPGLA